MINFNNVEFVTSVAQPNKFLHDEKVSIVFSGKSNVGKSSVINKLLNRKNFARVSSVPGKTIHVNYFLVDKKFYLVDLPGYGYAKVSQSEKERWNKLMESYFSDLNRFDLGVLILDSRHKPTADDRQMKEWFDYSGKPYIILLNKCDKLNKTEFRENPKMIRDELNLAEDFPCILFSAMKGTGKNELINAIVPYIK